MKKLRDFSLDDLGGGINCIDVGASGGVTAEWQPIAHWMNIIGFDPNVAECSRLNALPSGYCSAKFLPYALAGESGQYQLHKTKSIYCWSLLRPRLDEWLSRFAYSDLFEPAGTETISCYRLEEVPELGGMDVDAMKVDAQGVELPILKSGLSFVESSISIETETGLTQNYEGEAAFDQMLAFMDLRGFGLFGIDANHAISRKNRFSKTTRNEQLLWCEAVWLRDYYKATPAERQKLTRAKALRALCLYANRGCIAFGLEAAALFRDLNLITGGEYDTMARDESWWSLPNRGFGLRKAIHPILDYTPRRVLGKLRGKLASSVAFLDQVIMTPHPFKRK